MSVSYMPNPSAKAGICRSSSRFFQAAFRSLLFLGSLSPPMPSRGESGSPLFMPSSAVLVEGGSIAEMVFQYLRFLKPYTRFLFNFPASVRKPEFINLG